MKSLIQTTFPPKFTNHANEAFEHPLRASLDNGDHSGGFAQIGKCRVLSVMPVGRCADGVRSGLSLTASG